MATFASRLPVNATACNEILNQGACIFVKPLINCAAEPVDPTVTNTVAVVVGATTISLTTSATSLFVREGTVLTFGNLAVVTTLDQIITPTASLVNIEASTVAIPINTVTRLFGLLELISPENIPFNLEAKTVDRTDLKSFQESMVKTNIKFAPQIQCIAAKDDKALWSIFQGARSVQDVYAVIAYPSDQLVFGRALISGYNFDGGVGEIQRPQFTLEFQGKDYAITTTYGEADVDEQTLMNDICRRAGLPLFA